MLYLNDLADLVASETQSGIRCCLPSEPGSKGKPVKTCVNHVNLSRLLFLLSVSDESF